MKERGFKELTPLQEALEDFLEDVEAVSMVDRVPTEEADGRVLASIYEAPRDSPHYDRAAMDGYAVKAEATAGASPGSPVEIPLDEAEPVHTGSPMPGWADAVAMFEDVRRGDAVLKVDAPLTPGRNVGSRGEDVDEGSRLFGAGRRLTPPDVSLMRSLGTEEVEVFRRPEVSVIPTGEELVPPGEEPGPGEMVESNGLLVSLYVERLGGEPRYRRALTDDPDELRGALDPALDYDLAVFTGGSSVGRRDNVVDVIEGEGSVLAHGLAISPGKPTALCFVDDTPVLALPGYPAATAVTCHAVLRPVVERLAGYSSRTCVERARLSRKVYSKLGKRTYTRVSLDDGAAEPLRTSGAGILSSVARADGYVVTPEGSEGLEPGKEVEVQIV